MKALFFCVILSLFLMSYDRRPSLDTVVYTTDRGEVELREKGFFNISLDDKIMIKIWLPGDKIRVTNSENLDYPYKLENLDTESSVLAVFVEEEDHPPLYDIFVKATYNVEVELKDNGLFNISPDDELIIKIWIPGDKIRIEQSKDKRYPYTLQNLGIGDYRVHAQLIVEDNDIYRKIFSVSNIRDDGAILILDDGSIWGVAITQRYRSDKWNIGDKIKIHKFESIYYPYNFENMTQNSFVIGFKK